MNLPSDPTKLAQAIRALTVRGDRVMPVKLSSFDVQQYGEICTTKVKAGPSYSFINVASNAPKNAIEKIVLTRGGADDMVISGEQLVLLEAYKYRPDAGQAVNGIYFYTIAFDEILARTIDGQSQSMYVTLPGENITLNVHMRDKSAETGFGETWPAVLSLKATAGTTMAKPARVWLPETKTITTGSLPVGEADFYELPQDVYYKRLFLKGDIEEVELRQNGKEVIPRMTVDELHYNLKRANPELVIPAGYVVLDFIASGFANADLFNPKSDSDQDLKLTLKVGTAGHIPILVEGQKRVA